MKIRLLADDSKIPNYAIMKISTFHKRKGDDVDWYDPERDMLDTDILYHSRIFKFTKPYEKYPLTATIYRGGTGYDKQTELPQEIEQITELDYSLYPECDYSVIFASRGCIRKCKFCIVSQKEGLIHNYQMAELNPKGKWIKILDNNFFSNKEWRSQLATLKSYNQPLEFNTGIDLRILTEEQCQALKECKIKNIKVAWDNYKDKDIILPKLEMLIKYIKPYKITCFVLVGFESREVIPTDLERVKTLWNYGVYPFVMGYIDFNDPHFQKTQSVKDLQRWCDNRFIFKSCAFEEYRKGKGRE